MRTAAPLVHRIVSTLEALPRHLLFTLGGLMWVAVLLADLFTPAEVDVAFFYLFPIFIFTWFAGRRPGLLIAVASGAAYLGANLLQRSFAIPAIRYWNAFLQVGFFFTFTILIHELKRLADHDKALARIDTLTGATNLRGLRERTEVEIARLGRDAGSLAFALIDVDDFKTINDSFGHMVGDAVLVATVDQLRKTLRGTGVIARIGGDEFALLLPDTTPEEGVTVARRLQEALSHVMADASSRVKFSIGMVTFTQAPPSLDALMHEADALLYRVKNNGKNGFLIGVRPGTNDVLLETEGSRDPDRLLP
jgi:diguanylate cyclase (GGDEF)-like protein